MLHLTLLGHGVSPLVNLSVEDGLFDVGAVLVNEYTEKTFKVGRTCVCMYVCMYVCM